MDVGRAMGALVGLPGAIGASVGRRVGSSEGFRDGGSVVSDPGLDVGRGFKFNNVGLRDGAGDGARVGLEDGFADGLGDGRADGFADGCLDGRADGFADGARVP